MVPNIKRFCSSIFIVVLCCSIFVFSPGLRAADDIEAYESAKKRFTALKSDESRLSSRDSWMDVIDAFLSVYMTFPDSDRADDSLYMVGLLYRDLYGMFGDEMDLRLSVNSFEILTQEYPKSNLADDARFLIGDIYLKIVDDPLTAYSHFKRVVNEYPDGDMRSDAEGRMRDIAASGPDMDSAEDLAGLEENGGGSSLTEPPLVEETPTITSVDEGNGEKQGKILTRIRFSSSPGHTRVVLDLSGSTKYSFGDIDGDGDGSKPFIYIDMEGTTPGERVGGEVVIGNGLIGVIRTEEGEGDGLRVVLYISEGSEYKVFELSAPSRIVVDVFGEGGGISVPEVGGGEEAEMADIDMTAIKHTNIGVVVIDPGHGGKDPGAVGPTGYHEKSANLKIAKYLKGYLVDRLGLTVLLTRHNDKYLNLKERTALANELEADLFISIHNNASKDRGVYGVSTYFLSVTSDKKALTIAARENNTTIETLSELDFMLTDLMVSAKRNESSLLAKFVQEGMISSIDTKYDFIKDWGVLPGPFWVLVGAQMPCILVECSYISNSREEKRLKDDEYLKALAFGIYKGFERYITEIEKAKTNW